MSSPAPPAKPARARSARHPQSRAFGRSRADFGKLWRAEELLLDCCRRGEIALVFAKRPEAETDANRVRASFVRFLALGGDEENPVHEHGVQLRGAWLDGLLDLNGAEVARWLVLLDCVVPRMEARNSHLKYLNLRGSRLVEGLVGDGLVCDGNIFLREGFHATATVRLLGARIGGNLDCAGGRFEPKDGKALAADGAVISGAVFLNDGFHATGETRLTGVKINAYLDCDAGRFVNPGGDALNFDGAVIAGDAWLRDAEAEGLVRLLGATIGGDLVCMGAGFRNDGGKALSCDGARVSGALFFRALAAVEGSVDMVSLHVTALCDDARSWAFASGRIDLDGLTYARLAGGAPTDAAARIAWLDSQWPENLQREFKPQPWELLAGVLRAMGHVDEARKVAIAKQDRLRRAGKIARGAHALHWFYGLLVGYGYRPLRLLIATASVWLLCASAYWLATNPAWFGADTHLLAPPAEPGAPAPAPDYRNFVPLIYSADVLLPVVDLGYKDEWQPVVADPQGDPLIWGRLLRFLYWFEIAFGWVAGLLLVGVLGNLIKKD